MSRLKQITKLFIEKMNDYSNDKLCALRGEIDNLKQSEPELAELFKEMETLCNVPPIKVGVIHGRDEIVMYADGNFAGLKENDFTELNWKEFDTQEEKSAYCDGLYDSWGDDMVLNEVEAKQFETDFEKFLSENYDS